MNYNNEHDHSPPETEDAGMAQEGHRPESVRPRRSSPRTGRGEGSHQIRKGREVHMIYSSVSNRETTFLSPSGVSF